MLDEIIKKHDGANTERLSSLFTWKQPGTRHHPWVAPNHQSILCSHWSPRLHLCPPGRRRRESENKLLCESFRTYTTHLWQKFAKKVCIAAIEEKLWKIYTREWLWILNERRMVINWAPLSPTFDFDTVCHKASYITSGHNRDLSMILKF